MPTNAGNICFTSMVEQLLATLDLRGDDLDQQACADWILPHWKPGELDPSQSVAQLQGLDVKSHRVLGRRGGSGELKVGAGFLRPPGVRWRVAWFSSAGSAQLGSMPGLRRRYSPLRNRRSTP